MRWLPMAATVSGLGKGLPFQGSGKKGYCCWDNRRAPKRHTLAADSENTLREVGASDRLPYEQGGCAYEAPPRSPRKPPAPGGAVHDNRGLLYLLVGNALDHGLWIGRRYAEH